MKKGLLCLLLLAPLMHFGQTFSLYSDARNNGGGFSYNVTLQVTETGYNSYQKIKSYKVKIVSVAADSKGYYDLSHSKYYSCSQLGNICNPNGDYYRISFKLESGACGGQGRFGGTMSKVGDEQNFLFKTEQNTDCKVFIESVTVTTNTDKYRPRILEIEYPKKTTGNPSATPASPASTASGSTAGTNPLTSASTKSSNVYINGPSNNAVKVTGNSSTVETNSSNANATSRTVNAAPAVTTVNNYDAARGTYSNPLPYSTPVASDNFTRNVQNATTVINGLGQLLAANQAEKERRFQEEERRRIAAEQKAEAERQKKLALAAKLANRKAAIAEFPAKEIPLSSQEKAGSIYYFMYACDANNLNSEYGAKVYVSNVFEIGKYKDGTRPYATTINQEVASLAPYPATLHGYYYTMQEAEEKRRLLMNGLKNNGVNVQDIAYRGKPAATTNAVTGAGSAVQDKYGKTISIVDNNAANKNITNPKDSLKTTELETGDKYGKSIKID